MIQYKISTTTRPLNPYDAIPTSIAGTIPINGHRYGINSVSPAIKASDHLSGKETPNRPTIVSQTQTATQIHKHKISCPSSQSQSFLYSFNNLSLVYLVRPEIFAITVITFSFSIEKNTAITNVIVNLNIPVMNQLTTVTAAPPAFLMYPVPAPTI